MPHTLSAAAVVALIQVAAAADAAAPAFVRKPTATRTGEKTTVSFAISAPTDVTVSTKDANGRTVRHLAAGVLGKNAPAPESGVRFRVSGVRNPDPCSLTPDPWPLAPDTCCKQPAGAMGPARAPAAGEPRASEVDLLLEEWNIRRGLGVVLGLPEADRPDFVVDLAKASEVVVFFQSPEAGEVALVREAAEKAGLLGRRVFADRGDWSSIHLGDNLADGLFASPRVMAPQTEVLRVLHPRAKAILADKVIIKPVPEGIDHWSHPYHGPDNNPLSTDQIARAPYLTQFLAEPVFGCQPSVTVAAGGRIFKAFGHMAFRDYQNHALNTLFAINGYNGTILWKRPLNEGFMIHRNTMIATPETLFLADDESCKVIEAATGKVTGEIVVPDGLGDGPVWKWMALEEGVLYALVGGEERKAPVTPAPGRHCLPLPGVTGWPWGRWPGYSYDYTHPQALWAFGRTFLAADPKTGKVLWSYSEKEHVDGRAVCMKSGRIYFYGPGKVLGCLDARDGNVLWRRTDADLMTAIGPLGRAQSWLTGFATCAYVKCSDEALFFAGPQRTWSELVAVSTRDGSLLWRFGDRRRDGNYQLVLRPDALYAFGTDDRPTSSVKLDYRTGEVLKRLPARRACTRATGSADSLFYRAHDGTVRVDAASGSVEHLAPMRPPCQDGVIISDGLLYWGPWICGCNLSLFGHVCLGPRESGDTIGRSARPDDREPGMVSPDSRSGATDARLERGALLAGGQADDPRPAAPLAGPGDWPAYRGNSQRVSATTVAVASPAVHRWTFRPSGADVPTAPVAAGGYVFVGGGDGAVRALAAEDGAPRWAFHTGGAINFPPAVWQDRLYVGSNDGWVYALEAATGRLAWRFRAAPAEQWIPVFGRLMSRWPVAGGTVVEDGVVYAAAGIAHYDGTHVYALDAVTGKLRWYNDSSGRIDPRSGNGISLQGNLWVQDGNLCFPGGNVHATALYDLKTGACANKPLRSPTGTATRNLFYYPQFSNWVDSVDLPGNQRIVSDGGPLRRCEDPAPGEPPLKREHPWRPLEPQPLWSNAKLTPCRGVVLAADGVLLAVGLTPADRRGEEPTPVLAAVRMDDGSNLWLHRLPAPPVKWGLAVDREGRVFVSLEDGRVLCYR